MPFLLTRLHRRSRPYRTLAVAALLLPPFVTACDRAVVAWADDAPRRTTMPSPLVAPPVEAPDSALRADSERGQFLLAQDLLRDAGAASLLATVTVASLDSLAESRDPLTITRPLRTAASGAVSATAPATPSAPTAAGAVDHSAHGMAASPVAASVGNALGAADSPADAGQCARTLRMATLPGRGTVAVWWTRVSRGRVHLVAAWRDSAADGAPGVWRGPIPIDTADIGAGDAQVAEQGVHACARPAPGLVADARTAFVHVAYSVRGPEGAGVFYAHQMDPHAAFEPPIALLYGERLGEVRVAADGDVVAVGYDDPNVRGRARVGLAVSRTAGHLFEDTRLTVGADGIDARDPRVRVVGRAILLGWSESADPSATPTFVVRRAVVQRPDAAR